MTQPKIFFPKPNLDPAPQILMIRLDLFFIILLQPLPLLTHTFLLLPFPTRLCLKNIKSFRSQIISLRSQKKKFRIYLQLDANGEALKLLDACQQFLHFVIPSIKGVQDVYDHYVFQGGHV